MLSERIIAKTKDNTSIKSNVPKSIINCKNSKDEKINKVKIDICLLILSFKNKIHAEWVEYALKKSGKLKMSWFFILILLGFIKLNKFSTSVFWFLKKT